MKTSNISAKCSKSENYHRGRRERREKSSKSILSALRWPKFENHEIRKIDEKKRREIRVKRDPTGSAIAVHSKLNYHSLEQVGLKVS